MQEGNRRRRMSASRRYTTVLLALLVFQNASVSLLTRYSLVATGPKYSTAAAIFLTECVKCFISATLLIHSRLELARKKDDGAKNGTARWAAVLSRVGQELFGAERGRRSLLMMSVPAALYAVQNSLLYIALSNLPSAIYQTTYQLKLLTTALFTTFVMGRSLPVYRWLALCLLAAGVAVVQLGAATPSSSSTKGRVENSTKGLAAVAAACVSSAISGGWFEMLLKSTPKGPQQPGASSLHLRNLHLSIPSLLFTALPLVRAGIYPSDLLRGFTPLTWLVVLDQSVGGLLVSKVVKETSSVEKGFATSISILVSTAFSAVLFGTLPGPSFLTGAGMVILATVLYSF